MPHLIRPFSDTLSRRSLTWHEGAGLSRVSSGADSLINLFLLLYTIERGSRRGYLTGRVKLQKLLFEAEKRMTKFGWVGLSYVFYRWKHGPWSPEAQWGLEWLARNGLVTETEALIEATDDGHGLLDDARELVESNQEIMKLIENVSDAHALDTGRTMEDAVYGTPSPATGELMDKVKPGEAVLEPLEKSKASKLFRIDDSWIETLDILLDKSSRESLQQAMNDAQQGRIKPYKPLA